MKPYENFLNYIKPISGQKGFDKLNYLLNLTRGVLYNKLKFGRMTNTPLFVVIESTTRCNLDCKMCEHRNLAHKEIKELDFKQTKQIIDKIPYIGSVTFGGIGEPFCNKDFISIIRLCKEKGLRVVFPTNFNLPDSKTILQLILLEVDEVTISLDGATKKTYESVRSGANFDKVIENISEFSRLKRKYHKKYPLLVVQFVDQEKNHYEIPRLLKLCSKLGVDEVKIAPLVDSKKSDCHKTIQGENDRITAENIAKKLNLKLTYVPTAQSIRKCIWPFLGIFITSRGFVLPCCQVTQREFSREFLEKNSFGNILTQDFKGIWFSREYMAFREKIIQGISPLLCKNCSYYAGEK